MTAADANAAIARAEALYQRAIGTEDEHAALLVLRSTVDGIRREQIASGMHRRETQT